MSRGLGTRQRAVLAALQAMDRERGPGWRSPSEVIALVQPPAKASVSPPEMSPDERMIRSQLASCRNLVALGHRDYEAGVMLAEARLAQIEGNRQRRAQQSATRAPNLIRSAPRAGEAANPSRVLALLERRGLVVRQAHCGPGSAVRLADSRELGR